MKLDAKFWRVYYKIQELLAREYLSEYNPREQYGIRAESSFPHKLNMNARKLAEQIVMMHEPKGIHDDIFDAMSLTVGLSKEVLDFMDKKSSNDFLLAHVTKAEYHLALSDLVDEYRGFLDDEINADNYFIAVDESTQNTIGGFTCSRNGVLSGLFALEKGYGKLLFEEQLKYTIKHKDKDVNKLYLDCYGKYLMNLYRSYGFEVTRVLKWKDELAPKGWNYERFGKPNVYEMELSA